MNKKRLCLGNTAFVLFCALVVTGCKLPGSAPGDTEDDRSGAGTYTIAFHKNHATAAGSMSQQTGALGVAVNLTPNSFTRTGYTFTGWNTQPNGSGASYDDGASVTNLASATGATAWLYAQWEEAITPAVTYTIIFEKNHDDAGSMASQTGTLGAAVNLTPNSFTRTGYHFSGWNTDANGTGQFYADKESVTDLASTAGATVRLYAQWQLWYPPIGDITAYLASASGGALESPVPLELGLQLTGEHWGGLLAAIASADKFVELDLTNCTPSDSPTGGGLRSDGIFDPVKDVSTGKNRITAITLPNEVVEWSEGSDHIPNYFSELRSITGTAIQHIEDYAFYWAMKLSSVSFPAAKTIGFRAFQGCGSLGSVSFPAVETIGHDAFANCSSLTTIEIPVVLSMRNWTFVESRQLRHVTLGPTPPDLGTNTIGGNFEITVTVHIPASAKNAYGVPNLPDIPFNNSDMNALNWGNGFRGKGWNNGAFSDSSQRIADANLIFETY